MRASSLAVVVLSQSLHRLGPHPPRSPASIRALCIPLNTHRAHALTSLVRIPPRRLVPARHATLALVPSRTPSRSLTPPACSAANSNEQTMSASKLSVSSVRSSIAQILTESSGEKKRNFVRPLPLALPPCELRVLTSTARKQVETVRLLSFRPSHPPSPTELCLAPPPRLARDR